MKVVGHQAIGVELPAGLLARFGQGLEKAEAVMVVVENLFPPIATIHQVIDGAGILDSEFTRQAVRVPKSAKVPIVMTPYLLVTQELGPGSLASAHAKPFGRLDNSWQYLPYWQRENCDQKHFVERGPGQLRGAGGGRGGIWQR